MPALLLSPVFRRVLAALLALLVLVVGGTSVRIWLVGRGDDRRPSDVIVVLGAAQFDGRPGEVLSARLDHARALYEQGVAPRVITVGGSQAGDRFTEAEAGRRYLQSRGVEQVIAVGIGSNTLESIQALDTEMERQDWQTAVLVTDPLHSLRSRRMAQDLGIDAVTSPTRSGPSSGNELRYLARETAGYLYYRVFE